MIDLPGVVGPAEKPTEAICLSGGGANGAYEVGVLKALLAGKCAAVGLVDPTLFLGTSVGSFNASMLVSQWQQYGPSAIGNLERAWMERLAGGPGDNGVFRFRGDPASFIEPGSYLPNPLAPFIELATDGAALAWDGLQRAVYLATPTGEGLRERLANLFNFTSFVSTAPWHETLRTTIDYSAIRRERTRQLRIFATNWTTGRLRSFRNPDMTDALGPLAILASSSIPGVFPGVDVGAERYIDGGVLMNTPLRPALDEGADVLHVVYLDPKVSALPLSPIESTVATAYRMQTISWAALVNREIARARRINRGLNAIGRIDRGESAGISDAELTALAKSVVMVLGGRHRQTYRPVTIHRYNPGEELSRGPLGMLDLDREHLEAMIEKGFADASLHDCAVQCCVLPDVDFPDCATDEPS